MIDNTFKPTTEDLARLTQRVGSHCCNDVYTADRDLSAADVVKHVTCPSCGRVGWTIPLPIPGTTPKEHILIIIRLLRCWLARHSDVDNLIDEDVLAEETRRVLGLSKSTDPISDHIED